MVFVGFQNKQMPLFDGIADESLSEDLSKDKLDETGSQLQLRYRRGVRFTSKS